MKRIVAILSAISIFAGGMCASAATSASSVQQYNENYAELLRTLDIVAEKEPNYSADVSRAEFTVMLAKAVKLSETAYEKQYWDVTPTNENARIITAMTNEGYVTGYNDGSFKPKQKINRREALIMAVCTLGYKSPAANVKAYLQKADELELDDGVGSDMKLGDAYTLISNMLCSYTAQIGMDKGEINLKTGETTLLEKVYDLKYGEGVLYSSGLYTASGKINAAKGYSVIGNMRLASEDNYRDYLGYRVKYFYTDNDELIFCHKVKKQDNLVIKAEDIDSYTNLTLKYKNGGSSVKRVKLTAAADYIYNGRYVDYATEYDDSMMLPADGYIDLIDNDRDGVYDFVNIHSSYDVIVQSAYTADESTFGITAKNNSAYNVAFIDDDEHFYSVTDADGIDFDVTKLYKGDVMTVYASLDGKVIEAVYSNDKIEASVQKRTEGDDRYTYLTIGGEVYRIANGFSDDISFNKSAIIYFDVNGMVAAIEYIDGSEYETMLALEIREDESSESVFIRVLTAEDKTERIYFAQKVVIDGSQRKTPAAIYTELATNGVSLPYPVRCRINDDGLITDIDTPNESENETGDNLIERFSGSIAYKSTTGNFGGHFVATQNTLVYSIPDASNGAEAMRVWTNYGVSKKSKLKNDTTYNVKLYSIGKDGFTIDTALVVGTDAFTTSYGQMAVVSKRYTTIDEDNAPMRYMELTRGGEAITGFAEVGSSVCNQIDALNIGDIITYSLKADGEFAGIKEVYRYSDGAYLYNNGVTPSYASYMGSESYRFLAADAYVISGDYVGLVDIAHTGNVTDTDIEAYNFGTWYVYEVTGKKLEIRKATMDDIIEGKFSAQSASRVVIQTQYAQPGLAFIVK